MAKKQHTSKDIAGIKTRLVQGDLQKTDVTFLIGLIDSAHALRVAVEGAKKKVGGKTILASLPFGVDIVK
jgi:hypothetical protein